MTEYAIFPIFYLPPISYFKALKMHQKQVLFDVCEHFPKQTYRNRASIYSPNGKLNLTIPVQKGSNVHTAIKDVKISYSEDWQRLHWLSLQSCYRSSAYFEYYEADFELFYTQKYETLLDYNLGLLQLVFKCLKWNVELSFTSEYQAMARVDFREDIHPKKDALFQVDPYYQVFEEKFGFMNDLSIIDLLFNKGPQATQFI